MQRPRSWSHQPSPTGTALSLPAVLLKSCGNGTSFLAPSSEEVLWDSTLDHWVNQSVGKLTGDFRNFGILEKERSEIKSIFHLQHLTNISSSYRKIRALREIWKCQLRTMFYLYQARKGFVSLKKKSACTKSCSTVLWPPDCYPWIRGRFFFFLVCFFAGCYFQRCTPQPLSQASQQKLCLLHRQLQESTSQPRCTLLLAKWWSKAMSLFHKTEHPAEGGNACWSRDTMGEYPPHVFIHSGSCDLSRFWTSS